MKFSLQLSSVAQSCPTLRDPMDCSMPGLPVHHQLLELAQIHVHRVSDAIQPSSSVVPFSSCLQSFLASGSFLMSQFFASGGQSVGASASAEKNKKQKNKTKPLTLVNNLFGMGFCLQHEIEVTFFFCVDLNWPSIIYWKDHRFSSLSWGQHGKKSSDHIHMTCSRTLFCSIGLSTIVTTPHRLSSFYINFLCLVEPVLPLCTSLGFPWLFVALSIHKW